MTHRFEYKFDSPDQGCTVACAIEYEVEAAEYHNGHIIDGQLHIISVRALQIVGYDLDGNEIYDLLPSELSEGWAEALDWIADANVRESLDDGGCSCLGECLWENAGFCI